ncbi:MAG: hypothetical protein K9H84_07955 [Bacteroidales bacterium]|nr:hypothetical protein [Bacteroidales bacterium]
MIIFQNLLVSFVLLEVIKMFIINQKKLIISFISIVTGLTIFTGIAWYSNQLMPDIFAPLSILIIFILLFKKELSKWKRFILYVVLIFSLISHYSHLLVAITVISILIILKAIWNVYFNKLSYKNLFFLLGISFLAWIILPAIHYSIDKDFAVSKSSHIFFMAHLANTGILKDFLENNCDKPDYKNCKLCKNIDELPETVPDFIWHSDFIEKTGGWKNSEEEYKMVIRDIMTTPKYFLQNAIISFRYGLIQLSRNKVGAGLSPYKKASAPHMQIEWRFPEKEQQYLNSKQNQDKLSFSIINLIQNLMIILSLLITIYILFSDKRNKWQRLSVVFLIFILLSIFINSFITAGLAAPYARYQARIIWLLLLATTIFLITNYNSLLSTFKNRSNY